MGNDFCGGDEAVLQCVNQCWDTNTCNCKISKNVYFLSLPSPSSSCLYLDSKVDSLSVAVLLCQTNMMMLFFTKPALHAHMDTAVLHLHLNVENATWTKQHWEGFLWGAVEEEEVAAGVLGGWVHARFYHGGLEDHRRFCQCWNFPNCVGSISCKRGDPAVCMWTTWGCSFSIYPLLLYHANDHNSLMLPWRLSSR